MTSCPMGFLNTVLQSILTLSPIPFYQYKLNALELLFALWEKTYQYSHETFVGQKAALGEHNLE